MLEIYICGANAFLWVLVGKMWKDWENVLPGKLKLD